MANLKNIIIMFITFIATVGGTASNMNRVLTTDSNPLDDIFFILSIIFGVIIGVHWNQILTFLSKK